MTGDMPVTVAAATASLDRACAALDEAVLALVADGTEGDTVMASPDLVALLLHVVVARRNLKCLQDDRRPARPSLPQ